MTAAIGSMRLPGSERLRAPACSHSRPASRRRTSRFDRVGSRGSARRPPITLASVAAGARVFRPAASDRCGLLRPCTAPSRASSGAWRDFPAAAWSAVRSSARLLALIECVTRVGAWRDADPLSYRARSTDPDVRDQDSICDRETSRHQVGIEIAFADGPAGVPTAGQSHPRRFVFSQPASASAWRPAMKSTLPDAISLRSGIEFGATVCARSTCCQEQAAGDVFSQSARVEAGLPCRQLTPTDRHGSIRCHRGTCRRPGSARQRVNITPPDRRRRSPFPGLVGPPGSIWKTPGGSL